MRVYRIRILLGLAAGWCVGACSWAADATPAVEVPFEFYRNSILVQAKVNGAGPFSMLLDTGADPSIIDLETAKKIGLKLGSNGVQGSGGGTDPNLAYETALPILELGGIAARDVAAAAMDLTKPGAALGRPIQGVLGHSFLNHRIVQIDYPRRIVRFYSDPRIVKQSTSPSPTRLRFFYRDDLVVEGVLVNGQKMAANLDTGSNGSFQLTPAAVTQLGLESDVAQAQVSESTGFNGKTENRQGHVKNVRIGGISVDQPSVVFYGKGTGRDQETWGIRIGNAFLKDFIVTIDYPRRLITLERPSVANIENGR